jgi:hypothetical protein
VKDHYSHIIAQSGPLHNHVKPEISTSRAPLKDADHCIPQPLPDAYRRMMVSLISPMHRSLADQEPTSARPMFVDM